LSQKKSRAVTYILAAVGLVVGVYFVVKIWRETDVASALRLIALLPVPTIIMLALPSIAGAALDSKAWQLLLPRNGKRDSMWSMARVRVGSEAVVSTVPMGAIVADPLKAWLLKREFGLSLACGSASVALRTFLLADSQSILTLIVTIISFGWLMEVSPAILTGNGYLAWILLIASVVACVMYTALIYLGSHQASLERLHSGLRKIRVGFVSKWISSHEDNFSDLKKELTEFGGSHSQRLWISGALFALMWSVDGLETHLIAKALGLNSSLVNSYEIEILCAFLRSIAFFIPSGIGLQDAAYIAFFESIGAPRAGAAAFIVIKRLRQFVWIILGFGLLFTIRKVNWSTITEHIGDPIEGLSE
jgi:uncharacterized protein (TIRG00374 family)